MTKQSRRLDHQRRSLGIDGRVDRDQTAGIYRLTSGTEAIPLGARWREALATLQARSPNGGKKRSTGKTPNA